MSANAFLILLSVLATISLASAAESIASTNNATTTSAPSDLAQKLLSLGLDLEYANNLYKEGDPSQDVTLGIGLAPSYKISDSLIAAAVLSLTQQQTKAKNTTLSNSLVGLQVTGFQLGENLNTTHSLFGVLATDAELRKSNSFQGALRMGHGFSAEVFGASVKYTFLVLRNFHQFVLAADGKANLQYSLQHRVDLLLPVTKRFSLDLSGTHRSGYTYRNFSRFNYFFASTLSYEVAQNFSVYGGFSTDAPAVKANGTDSNIQLFDEHASFVRTGVNYLF